MEIFLAGKKLGKNEKNRAPETDAKTYFHSYLVTKNCVLKQESIFRKNKFQVKI